MTSPGVPPPSAEGELIRGAAASLNFKNVQIHSSESGSHRQLALRLAVITVTGRKVQSESIFWSKFASGWSNSGLKMSKAERDDDARSIIEEATRTRGDR